MKKENVIDGVLKRIAGIACGLNANAYAEVERSRTNLHACLNVVLREIEDDDISLKELSDECTKIRSRLQLEIVKTPPHTRRSKHFRAISAYSREVINFLKLRFPEKFRKNEAR